MAGIVSVISTIAIFFMLGFCVLIILWRDIRRISILEVVSISLGLGMGLASIWGFFLLRLGMHLSIATIAVPIFIVSLLFFLVKYAVPKKRKAPPVPYRIKPRFGKIEVILWGAILFLILYAFWASSILPLRVDDAISMWGLKAKIIFYGNTPQSSFRQTVEALRSTMSADYPLLLPFAESFISINARFWNDSLSKVIFPLFYTIFIFSFYSALKRLFYASGKNQNKVTSLLFTFLLFGLPFISRQATVGVADLAFTFYCVMGFIYMYLWMNNAGKEYLSLSALFLGFSMWTKMEGIPSLLISISVLIVFLIVERKTISVSEKRSVRNFVIIMTLFSLFILYYRSVINVSNRMVGLESFSPAYLSERFGRIPVILYSFQKQFFGAIKKWNIFMYLFLFLFVINIKNVFKKPIVYIMIAIILNIVLYTWIYVVTEQDVRYHMDTSQNRILMHFIPLIVFLTAILAKLEIGRKYVKKDRIH